MDDVHIVKQIRNMLFALVGRSSISSENKGSVRLSRDSTCTCLQRVIPESVRSSGHLTPGKFKSLIRNTLTWYVLFKFHGGFFFIILVRQYSKFLLWFGASSEWYVLYITTLFCLMYTTWALHTEFEHDSRTWGVKSSLMYTTTPPCSLSLMFAVWHILVHVLLNPLYPGSD